MNDRMTPIPFGDLMNWILAEKDGIFGVKRYFQSKGAALPLLGQELEIPCGPAAGPHTQLAQNIIAAYVAGARFFELKTVQTLDGEDLPVSKPCIRAEDECYNVEWSTELTVGDAMNEYIKAWIALKILSKELALGNPDGFIFNMSVGYNLDGIRSEKIDGFIEGLKDASSTSIWQACTVWLGENLGRFAQIDGAYLESLCPHVCSSVTLSTLHGCPSGEIERIAAYLLEEKGLHTYVKCNPTLLGYEYARKTLDALGYGYLAFDAHHFKEDLQFQDAVPMLERLLEKAHAKGLTFGVKLTNTFPVEIRQGELPGDEMYMSGKALFPLSMAVAARLSKAFGGKLPISYSGGADALNIGSLFQAGICPITVATTVLKPGGYQRFTQLAEILEPCGFDRQGQVDTEALETLAEDAAMPGSRYSKPAKPLPSRKNGKKVPLFSCTFAPCSSGCPIEQDIPQYIRLAGSGDYAGALQVILEKNPLPFMTGTICNHKCTDRCRRNHYEEAIDIRSIKLIAAQNAFDQVLASIVPKAQFQNKVAVIGGGPAGIAAAHLLARAGMNVTVFEKRSHLGGVVKYIIPDFRIGDDAIQRDVALAKAFGAQFVTNHEITSPEQLSGYKYVVVATGAWKSLPLAVKGAVPAFDFLEKFNKGESLKLGKNVVVVGGGDTAMDAARAAKRVPGVENVSIVYRRDRQNMPAQEEELAAAQADGVAFLPLLSPLRYQKGLLTCAVMELGHRDEKGRRTPMDTGETRQIPADTVISSVGVGLDPALLAAFGVAMNSQAIPLLVPKSNLAKGKIYVCGDGASGPSTVVQAIASAHRAVRDILAHEGAPYPEASPSICSPRSAQDKRGVLSCKSYPSEECGRCLGCDSVCQCCVDVCPNRANVSIETAFGPQILHIDRMCNECGNCAVFCPYDSAPYRDKLTLFHTEADFSSSANSGFLVLDRKTGLCKIRLGDMVFEQHWSDLDDSQVAGMIYTVLNDYSYLL